MTADKMFFAFFLFVFGSTGWSQSPQSMEPIDSLNPEVQAAVKSYKFEKPSAKGKKESFATLRFLEMKELVRLEFEGHDMERGKYEIIKTASCEKLKRRLLANKPMLASETSLFAFSTEYGQISTEKNFNGQKLQDLGLESSALALVKTAKSGDHFVACAE